MMRSQSTIRIAQTVRSAIRPSRCLTTTTPRKLGEPDPRDIPAAEAMQSTEDQASMIVAERKETGGSLDTFHPKNQPDYNAHVDYATGQYSPVPRRVQDGSEPGLTLSAAVLSGAPVDLQARTVR